MKPQVMKLARKLYREIINSRGRIDDKPRTGLSLSMWTLPMSRNLLIGKVRKPSDAAIIFSVQKSTISNERGDYSSLNHKDPSKMLFEGSFTIDFNGYSISGGGSGLIGFEDAAIMVILLAFVTKQEVLKVLLNIRRERNGKIGQTPKEFGEEGHYIRSLILRYNMAFVD